MPKVEFIKDVGSRKIGDIVELDGMIVVELLKQKVAKKYNPKKEAKKPSAKPKSSTQKNK